MNQLIRLVDLIQRSIFSCTRLAAYEVADFLLSEGVYVPSLKIGQTIFHLPVMSISPKAYVVKSICIDEGLFKYYAYDSDGILLPFSENAIGFTIFPDYDSAVDFLDNQDNF